MKSRGPCTLNRILLLSDGQEDNPLEALRAEADQCRQDGVVVYSVGLGEDHDEEKMVAIEEVTGGDFEYAQQPEEVVTFFETQTKRMLDVAVRKMKLRLTPSMHVTINRLLNDNYHYVTLPSGRPDKGDGWEVDLHDLSRGEAQSLIFEMHCSHGIAGEFRIAQAELTYELTDGGPGQAAQDILLTYTEDMNTVRTGRNVEVLRRREELNVALVLGSTMAGLRDGKISAADAAQQLDSAAAGVARFGDSNLTQELTSTIHKLSGGDASSQVIKSGTQIATTIKRVGK
jgi:hypothetical protein